MALQRQKNGRMNSLLEENKALLVELNDLENINKGKCNIKSTHCFFPWCHTTLLTVELILSKLSLGTEHYARKVR